MGEFSRRGLTNRTDRVDADGNDLDTGEGMNTTSRILHDVANHYNHLIDEHQKLDKELESLQNTYQPDHIIKDEIVKETPP